MRDHFDNVPLANEEEWKKVMDRTINRITIMGHIGREPRISYTVDAVAVANFTVATSRPSLETKKEMSTEWHHVIALGKNAEMVRELVKEGTKVFIEGALGTRKWRDKTTHQTHYLTEIIANHIEIISNPKQPQPRDKHFHEPEKDD